MDIAETVVDALKWDTVGLVPVIVQALEGTVLMHAWMNRAALAQSLASGYATYWSRSRQCLWQKGESSGHTQKILEVRLDCDKDTLLLIVEQQGGIACHTGRQHCFFRRLEGQRWVNVEAVIKSPEEIYSVSAKDES